MSVAHYRIYELDPADEIMDGYSGHVSIGRRGSGDGQQLCGEPCGCGRGVGERPARCPP
jgi:hypothetical protein